MSHPASGARAVVAALAANSGITIAKFTAVALSGSGAMMSEAVHSLADTGNQFLLFVGLTRSRRRERRRPTNRRNWLPVSARLCTASESMAPDPDRANAADLARVMPEFATRAAMTARLLEAW